MRAEKLPMVITEAGVSARIRKISQTKNGRNYTSYVVDYVLLGKRKQKWHAELAAAKAAASDACTKIANGEQLALELRNGDRLAYLRATEALAGTNTPIDIACREYANAVSLLHGFGTLTEAARFFAKHHVGIVNKSISEAVDELIDQIETEQKNTHNGTRRKDAWLKLLGSHLKGKLARDFHQNVTELSSATLEPWLIGLKGSERTRSNIRDCVAFFIKWAKGRNYLPKDADPLANVQKFRKRKRGAVQIISANELAQLLAHAPEDFVPYLALRAFAGLRDCEARALDWQYVDLGAGWIDIPEHVAKQADDDEGVARMARIRPVLAAWLRPHAKKSGAMCQYANSVKKLGEVKRLANVKIPRNALRHSFISAAVTLSNDLNGVSIEAGNSVTIIRQHYWRKMRPDQANAWFNVMPIDTVANLESINQAA
jgi:integrase